MCARHGREAIEIFLSEKGALAKKDWETLFQNIVGHWAKLAFGCSHPIRKKVQPFLTHQPSRFIPRKTLALLGLSAAHSRGCGFPFSKWRLRRFRCNWYPWPSFYLFLVWLDLLQSFTSVVLLRSIPGVNSADCTSAANFPTYCKLLLQGARIKEKTSERLYVYMLTSFIRTQTSQKVKHFWNFFCRWICPCHFDFEKLGATTNI